MTRSNRVPHRRFHGEAMQTMMMALAGYVAMRNQRLDKHGWTGRRVLGYKLPAWQRPEAWTDAQCCAFIENVYLGATIGTFMVNDCPVDEFDQILLDGQQRLRALERYWNSEIAVPGEDGILHVWGDLEEKERVHMLRISFPWIMTRYEEESILKAAYNCHNFSGTPHMVDQMATGAASLRTATPGIPRF